MCSLTEHTKAVPNVKRTEGTERHIYCTLGVVGGSRQHRDHRTVRSNEGAKGKEKIACRRKLCMPLFEKKTRDNGFTLMCLTCAIDLMDRQEKQPQQSHLCLNSAILILINSFRAHCSPETVRKKVSNRPKY